MLTFPERKAKVVSINGGARIENANTLLFFIANVSARYPPDKQRHERASFLIKNSRYHRERSRYDETDLWYYFLSWRSQFSCTGCFRRSFSTYQFAARACRIILSPSLKLTFPGNLRITISVTFLYHSICQLIIIYT